jgi:hypothetical protein
MLCLWEAKNSTLSPLILRLWVQPLHLCLSLFIINCYYVHLEQILLFDLDQSGCRSRDKQSMHD